MSNQEVARTIIAQLGGKQFSLLTGAKQFVSTEKGVSFKIGRNPKGITHVTIELDRGRDLYDIKFQKWNGRKLEMKTVNELRGIYFDQMADIFFNNTGLYTSFR